MRPGAKPKGQVTLQWSPKFAYAIGLIAADGCLSKDGRHIDLTSTDKAQVILFRKCLGLTCKVGKKYSSSGNLAYHAQFGDVLFYRFLQGIGLTPAKSKTLSRIQVPDEYFIDFLRGYFDGDGSTTSYYDPIFPKSFRFYMSFTSASPIFVDWLKSEVERILGVKGYISLNRNNPYVQLKYAKNAARMLSGFMYYSGTVPCLKRKQLKIKRSMRIIDGRRGGEIGKRTAFRSQRPQGLGSSSLPHGTTIHSPSKAQSLGA